MRLKRFSPREIRRRAAQSPRWLGECYTLEDNSQVTVYTDQPELFPNYPLVQSLQTPKKQHIQVSLISTSWNEGKNAARFMESLLAQTRQPDEIVIVDGGSSDATLDTLQTFANRSAIPCKIISEPGANISRGRNIAIANASFAVIASADFGCQVNADWLEKLVAPFEIDLAMQVVAGWFDTLDVQGNAVSYRWLPNLSTLNPQDYLPSSRSIAFTKAAWQSAGGYPEWLTRTGEDTYFDLQLKHLAQHWAFVPDARVRWTAPATTLERWKKLYAWSIGDGEAGIVARSYRWMAFKFRRLAESLLLLFAVLIAALVIGNPWIWGGIGLLAVAAILWWGARLRKQGITLTEEFSILGVYAAKLLGYFRGMRNRSLVNRRRFETVNGVFFILSGIPIDDTGGGARCTQIALELLHRNWLVVFINKFPKYETVELNLQIRHPNLITAQIGEFSLERFWQQYGDILADKTCGGLIEFPLEDFLPLVEKLSERGVHMIYDLLDDWKTSLGAAWYTPETEQKIVDAARAAMATAPTLVTRLQKMTSKPVAFLPNAVNGYLFNPQRTYPRPADFPQADWIVLYIGALWGEWFDWDLLANVARTYPAAAVVVIGDYAEQCKNPPPNLHFLGLKAQRTLPAYLAHADVAIIPWKVNEITQATSPLKVYEYLAMHKPVVAPDLIPLRGLPGIFAAQDSADFVALVNRVRQEVLPKDEIAAFIAQNNWQARVDALLEMVNPGD